MARHGNELHLIRPDRVYGTGVLTSIPGFNPVPNAMDVAARFTAIWAPNVMDAPAIGPPVGSGAGVTATMTTPPATSTPSSGVSGFGAGAMNPIARLRMWWHQRQFKKALQGYRGRQISGFGDVRDPAAKYGSVPVVGGYAPAFQTQADVGLAITSKAVQSGRPPFMPAAAAGAGISPDAYARQTMARDATAGLPGTVGMRAAGAAISNVNASYGAWPWWSR